MESLLSACVFVIICLTVKDIASAHEHHSDYETDHFNVDDIYDRPCRMRYCNDLSATIDIERASDWELDCQCDDLCWRRRDCCLNFLNETNVDDRTYYFGIPKAVIDHGQLYNCNFIADNLLFGYSFISKCGAPDEFTDKTWQWQRSLCEQQIRPDNNDDLLLRVPVYSYVTGETYKNIYCAACHNDLANIASWNTTAICTEWSDVYNLNEALQNMYKVKNDNWPICKLKLDPQPQMEPIQCIILASGFIRGCPEWFLNSSTSAEDADRRKEIEWLCQVTRGFVSVNGTDYESLYCAACHLNETDIGAVIQSKHGHCVNNYSPSYVLGYRPFKSFAVLLDFNIFSKRGNEVGVSKRCSDGYIYDAFTGKCRSIVCSKGHRYYNGKCQRRRHFSSRAILDNDIQITNEILEELSAAVTDVDHPLHHLWPNQQNRSVVENVLDHPII